LRLKTADVGETVPFSRTRGVGFSGTEVCLVADLIALEVIDGGVMDWSLAGVPTPATDPTLGKGAGPGAGSGIEGDSTISPQSPKSSSSISFSALDGAAVGWDVVSLELVMGMSDVIAGTGGVNLLIGGSTEGGGIGSGTLGLVTALLWVNGEDTVDEALISIDTARPL
jgi:hypothetical protein